MRLVLRKLFGASAGAGVCGGFFVVALTGLIGAMPCATLRAALPEPVLLIDYPGSDALPSATETDEAGWRHVANTGNYKGAGAKTVTETFDGGVSLALDRSAGQFFGTTYTGKSFADGLFLSPNGQACYSSVADEMKATLGVETLEESWLFTGVNNGQSGAKVTETISGLTDGTCYTLYAVAGINSKAGYVKLNTYDTTHAPVVSYVSTDASGAGYWHSGSASGTSCPAGATMIVRIHNLYSTDGQIVLQTSNGSNYGNVNLLALAATAAAAPVNAVGGSSVSVPSGSFMGLVSDEAGMTISQALSCSGTLINIGGTATLTGGGTVTGSLDGAYALGGTATFDLMSADLSGATLSFVSDAACTVAIPEEKIAAFGEVPAGVTFVTGTVWLWNYDFDGNAASTGTDTGALSLEGSSTSYTEADASGNQALYFQKTPYRSASFSGLAEMTALMVCQPGDYANTALVGFGTKQSNAVILATGANPAAGEMKLMLNLGGTVTELAALSADGATARQHLYAFVMDRVTLEGSARTRFRIYLDGEPVAVYTHTGTIALGNGFQIGSVHGGIVGNLSKYPSSGDSGTIDSLRVKDSALSDAEIRLLAAAYRAETGVATRTLEGGTAAWTAEEAWTQSLPGAADALADAPAEGSALELTAADAATLAFAFGAGETFVCDALTVKGPGAFTLSPASAFSAGTLKVSGRTRLETDATLPVGNISLRLLELADGVTLTFDPVHAVTNELLAQLASAGMDATASLPLASLSSLGEGASVKLLESSVAALETYGVSVSLVYNAGNTSYSLDVTWDDSNLSATQSGSGTVWQMGRLPLPIPEPETVPAAYRGTLALCNRTSAAMNVGTSLLGGSVLVVAEGDVSGTRGPVVLTGACAAPVTVQSGATLAVGAAATVTGTLAIRAGGVFDLNGASCSQSVTLDGGTLADSAAAEALVASVNFRSTSGKLADGEVGGLVPAAGANWNVADGGSGTKDLFAVPLAGAQAAVAADARTTLPGALTWSGGQWAASSDYSFMKGYLDDTGSRTLTLAMPEALAARGYDVYLYSNTDSSTGGFSARDVTGDDGETVSYSYANGELVAGSDASWGNIATGRTTLQEGVNVMVLRSRTDRSLQISFPDRTVGGVRGRGCVAALQVVVHAPVYSGALVLRSDSFVSVAEGGGLTFSSACSGTGALTKRGEGALTLEAASLGSRRFAVEAGGLTVGEGCDLSSAQLEIAAGQRVSVEAGTPAVALDGLAGEGTLALGSAAELVLSGAYGNAAFSGTLSADEPLTLVKRGAALQTLGALPAETAVVAEAGTLALSAPAVLRSLQTAGGSVEASGASFATAYAELASGSVQLAVDGTAASAKPAMASPSAAAVTRFTLAQGGVVRYDSAADLDKYFPAGFIPARSVPYAVYLGSDLADELTYPHVFMVRGAENGATFTLLSADGSAAPAGTWSAKGGTITLLSAGAIAGDISALPDPKYHYTFDGTAEAAGDAVEQIPVGSGVVFAESPNGQAMAGGTPWSAAAEFGADSWTVTAFANVGAMAENAVLFNLGGSGAAGSLILAKGAGNSLRLWRCTASKTAEVALEGSLGASGDGWHFIMLTHTRKNLKLSVDGALAASASGDFSESLSCWQFGSVHGGLFSGLSNWSASPGMIDDWAFYDSVLRDDQPAQAMAKVAGAWRWHSAVSPEALLDPAATDWRDALGAPGAWIGAEGTALLTATEAMPLEDLFAAAEVKGFAAEEVRLSGETLSYAPAAAGANAMPGVGRLCLDNALDLDVSALALDLLTDAYGAMRGVPVLALGGFSGSVTLRGLPEGFSGTAKFDGSALRVSLDSSSSVSGWGFNFYNSGYLNGSTTLSGATLYGMDPYRVAGSNWNNVNRGGGSSQLNYTVNSPIRLENGQADSSVKLSGFTFGGWASASNGYDSLTRTYADGSHRATLSGVRAGAYKAVVYFFNSAESATFSPVRVNGVYYSYRNGALTASPDEVPAAWGGGNVSASVEGQNVAVVPVTVSDTGDYANTIEVEVFNTNRQGGLDWVRPGAYGCLAGLQFIAMPDAYIRTVSANGTWVSPGAWTRASDGAAVDAPPEGALAILGADSDVQLTVPVLDFASPALDLHGVTVVGSGRVALICDASAVGAEAYEAIPNTGKSFTLFSGVHDADSVRVWMDGLNYGATASISQDGAKATASVTLPANVYPDRRLVSANFWDFAGQGSSKGRLTGTATAGAFTTSSAHWAQPVADASEEAPYSQTLDLKQVRYAQRSISSAAYTTLPGALTFSAYGTCDGGNASRSVLVGFLSDLPLGGDSGANPHLSIAVPADWGKYSAVIYASANSDSAVFHPYKVNGKWYAYQNGSLTALDELDPETNPSDSTYFWGQSATKSATLSAGRNYMSVPGLTGDFSLEWYALFDEGGEQSLDSRGCVAAVQLIEDMTPALNRVDLFQAEVAGAVEWSGIVWRDASGAVRSDAPGSDSIVVLRLAADAEIACDGAAAAGTLQIYGNGHAVAFHDRDNLSVGQWRFLNDTTLALSDDSETAPAATDRPHRVRYDYAFSGSHTTTANYETEFAAGFSGSFTPAGGTTVFSGGKVAFSTMNTSATYTKVVFSGDTQASASEVRFNYADVTLRDTAALAGQRLVLTDGSSTPRITRLTLEDDASITVTGSDNSNANTASFLMSHWSGTSIVTVRDRARILSERAELVLVHGSDSDQTQTLSIEDDAEVRVAGIATHGSSAVNDTVRCAGGRLLIGSRGIRSYDGRTFALQFAGGAIGAWEDVLLGADAAAAVSAVSGGPAFDGEPGATLTLTQPAPLLSDASSRLVFRRGNVCLAGSAFTTLPALETAGGSLTLSASLSSPSLRLRGGALTLAGGALTVDALAIEADTLVSVPLAERLSDGGYIALSDGLLPDFGHAIFNLVLNPDRPDTESILPRVPLVLGSYEPGAEPTVKGFGVTNNANGALTGWDAVFVDGEVGSGLYAELKGNEVLRQFTAELAPGRDFLLPQSTAAGWPFVVFQSTGADSLLSLPAGGVALSHATFAGDASIRVKAQGSEPHVLLRGVGYTFGTDTVFDLSAWAAAMPDVVRGAVKGVPASLCLVSGGVVKAPANILVSVDLGGYELPNGFAGTVEMTADGIYYVVRADRRTRTVSANFTSAGQPLEAPPSITGVYGVPLTAWNDLAGVFSSSSLKLSDAGGGWLQPATTASGSPTQLLAYGTSVGKDAGAPVPMLKVWMSDSAAQTVRVTNIPFEKWRLALVFSNDLAGAQYAALEINGALYSMDAEGYVRRNVLAYGNTIPADFAWGSTDRAEAAAPIVLGRNALVTDVLSGPELTLELPAFTYAARYAGVAALQILEAPAAQESSSVKSFSYEFVAGGEYALTDLTLSGGGAAWENGADNQLTLVCDHDATLVLPEGFEADRITASGSGTLALRVAGGGGAALAALNASRLANVTVGFPAIGLSFTPAQGVSRFEGPFDNQGEPYVIAHGATLALGADSGITTSSDGVSAPMLTIGEASVGTLRRDAPAVISRDWSSSAYSGVTWAFKNVTFNRTDATHVAFAPNILVEEGDAWDASLEGLWLNIPKSAKTYSIVQTGGSVAIATNGGDRGFLGGVNTGSPVDVRVDISGGRFEASQAIQWLSGGSTEFNVSGNGVLALHAGAGNYVGALGAAASSTVSATFSGRGTLEPQAGRIAKYSTGTVSLTFAGGRIATSQAEVAMEIPASFEGTASEPTLVEPDPFATILLAAANTGSGVLEVTQGVLASSNMRGLGSATAVIRSGAAYEARGFAESDAATGTVRFEAGSVCSATASGASLPYTAKIAGALVLPDGAAAVDFRLNGAAYDGALVEVDAANGTVTFTEAAKFATEAVTWDADAAAGVWEDGKSGPWAEGKTYRDGAAVVFDSVLVGTTDRAQVSVNGPVAPASLAFGAGSADKFDFAQGVPGAYVDASALGATLDLGAGLTYDVPIFTASTATTLAGTISPEVRLVGAAADGRKTASLVGSANLNAENDDHGVWLTEGIGSIVFTPHAGETQVLSPFGKHLSGGGQVTVAGQVAEDGSVSGGTVRFAGYTPGTNWNGSWSGAFFVRDGATLDFAMTRDSGDDGDDAPYFRADTSPLWTDGAVGFRLTNGATLRFSGTRGILGGRSQREDAALVRSLPIVAGRNCRVEYNYAKSSNGQQHIPYGLYLNGDGATLYAGDGAATGKGAATRGLYFMRGATVKVAGIGDEADPADPKCDADPDSETYGTLTAGITAFIDAMEGSGLVRSADGLGTLSDTGVNLDVGAGSELRVLCDVTTPSTGSSADAFFRKTGPGRVTFEHPDIGAQVLIRVDEGAMGGTAEFSADGSAVSVSAGAGIEAGLAVPLLTLGRDVTLYLDPTGRTLLSAGRVVFASGARYTVDLLPGLGEVPSADGLAPVKIMSWDGSSSSGSAIFTPSAALRAKGYGIEIREDGLYAMHRVTYVRELADATAAKPAGSYAFSWYADGAWRRADDPETPRDYDPAGDETVTACFVVPDSWVAEGATVPMAILLNKKATFSTVRFVAASDYAANGDEATPLLLSTVTYRYNLAMETMPEAGETRSFTWVPTLVVESPAGSVSRILAYVVVEDLPGYTVSVSERTAVVYTAATRPVVNVNFTERGEGDPSWIDDTVGSCGATAFPGVYWNNASPFSAGILATSGSYTAYSMRATAFGVESETAGEAATVELNYITSGAANVPSRRGTGNAGLAAGFLPGSTSGALPAALVSACNMDTELSATGGWRLRVDSVPFAEYDLYLLYAGESEGACTHSPVYVKSGDDKWHAYGASGGWTTLVRQNDLWKGQGGLADGGFAVGKNLLHIRVSAASAGKSLEVVSVDRGNTSTPGVGLAALQIVQCEDGSALTRVGAGSWSDALGWHREVATGTQTGAWEDSTDEAPRAVYVPTVSALNADMAASAPYMRVTGGGVMTLSGTPGALDIPAVDMGEMVQGGTVHFAEEVFASPPNVFYGAGTFFSLPEGGAGTTFTNRWKFVNDPNVTGDDTTTATLLKRNAGDLVVTSEMVANLSIADGILWLGGTSSYTNPNAISGDGDFGWRGSGTLTLTGDIALTGEKPIRATSGILTFSGNNFSGLSASAMVMADGGTINLPNSNKHKAGLTYYAANGGTLVGLAKGNASSPANSEKVWLAGGGTLRTPTYTEGWLGQYFNDVRATGKGNRLYPDAVGYGGSCMTVQSITVDPDSELVQQGNANAALRVIGGVISVGEGGTFTNKNRLGVGQTSGYGYGPDTSAATAASKVIHKRGPGTWVIEAALSAKGDANLGQTLAVDEGECVFALGGNSYSTSASAPVTVNAGGILGGYVSLGSNTPVTVKSGGAIRNGRLGVSGTKLTVHTLTLEEGCILDYDLANQQPLTVSSTVTVPSAMTVRLRNLNAYAGGNVKLVDLPSSATRLIKFTAPEALALDAQITVGTDGDIYLSGAGSAYVWSDRDGDWSDAAWKTNTVSGLSFPYVASATDDEAPAARFVTTTAASELSVTRPDLPTTPDDGVFWGASALILSPAASRTATLAQGSADAKKPNGIAIGSALWKLGAGDAVVETPLRFANLGAKGIVNVNSGTLVLKLPFSKESATDLLPEKNALPEAFPVSIESGATLDYALEALHDADDLGFNPLQQVLLGPVTGDGTLRLSTAGETLILRGASDSNLDYDVRAGTLRLAGDIAATTRSTRRVLSVAAGARAELMAEGALGWTSNRVIALEAAEENGARVTAESGARVRGTVSLARAASAAEDALCTATLGSVKGALDGDTAFDVPEQTLLELEGVWQTPANATGGALAKTGAGELHIAGDFNCNLPMDIREGIVSIGSTGGGLVSVLDLNATATVADWTVESGAALAFRGLLANDLNGGTLTVRSGGELHVGAEARFVSALAFEDGATVRFGIDGARIHGMTVGGSATLGGLVTVNLDALDPATFNTTGQSSYTLFTFERGTTGSGAFVLGGRKLVAWAQAGWTLRESGSQVLLESFGGTDGYYRWEGTAEDVGPANWGNVAWVEKGAETPVAWPTADTGATPAALFEDYGHDGTEIPAAARTVDWNLRAQTLSALRVDNNLPGAGDAEPSHDYVFTADGAAAPQLTLAGALLKTGSAKATFKRPVAFGVNGALRLLGGETAFASTLVSAGNTFSKPVTLAGGATLAFEGGSAWRVNSLIDGDGTGRIAKTGTGTLTLGSDLSGVSALSADGGGAVNLVAAEQYAVAPPVTLGAETILSYGGAFSTAGEVTQSVNAGLEPQGIFQWTATASADSTRVPRLAAPAGAETPALNVAELRYLPAAGHLVLDPGHAVLPSSAVVALNGAPSSATALWMGARTDDGATFDYAGLSGVGQLGVEPLVDPFADSVWSTNRVFTLRLQPGADANATAFRGVFAGGVTASGTAIQAGLALRQAAPGQDATAFVYSGVSTDAQLGALDVGDGVRAEVNGVWAGSAAVSAAGGVLAGAGTVGGEGKAIAVPAGAGLSASAYGARALGGGLTRNERIPTTLSLGGTLSLEPGSKLTVLVRRDLENNNEPWVSCIEAESLVVPTLVAGGTTNEVVLDIDLDIEDGAYASDVKILGWKAISGARLSGRITINGGPNTAGYVLKQKADGLYLRRSNARFWMILR